MSTLGSKNVCPHYPRWPKWTSGKWLWQAELEHPNIPVLSSKACEYFALHGKEDFADVAKLRTLRWKDDPVDPMSSQGSLKADNLLLLCSEGRCDNGKKLSERCSFFGFEEEGALSQGTLATSRARRQFPPTASRKECKLPADALILVQRDACQISTIQNYKMINL